MDRQLAPPNSVCDELGDEIMALSALRSWLNMHPDLLHRVVRDEQGAHAYVFDRDAYDDAIAAMLDGCPRGALRPDDGLATEGMVRDFGSGISFRVALVGRYS